MKARTRFIAIYFMMVVTGAGKTLLAAAPVDSSEPGLSSGERNRRTVLKYLGPVLRSAKKAGRLYYFENCASDERDPLPFPKLKVRLASREKNGVAAVRDLFRTDEKVRITGGPDGIIRISVGRVPNALLQTRISLLKFKPEEQYTGALAVGAIITAKEIKAAIENLGLHQPLTVYSINVQEPMKGLPHLPATLRNVTMDQALDAVGRTFGGLIVYGECTSRSGPHFFCVDMVELVGIENKFD